MIKLLKWAIPIFIFVSLQASASQVAVVATSKAIIWADLAQTTPIGYVRQGKKLLVGDVLRKRGSMLPVIIYGKVGWISLLDISLKDKKYNVNRKLRVSEHDVEELYKKEDDDPFSENNYLLFHYKNFNPDEASLNAMEAAGDPGSSSQAFGGLFEHRNPYKNYAWGVGVDYYSITSESVEYRTLALAAQVSWIPLKFKTFSVEAFAGVNLSGDFRVVVNNIGEERGQMYGLKGGLIARFFPQSKYGFYIGSSVERNTISGIKDLITPPRTVLTDVNTLNGTNLFFLGLAIKI